MQLILFHQRINTLLKIISLLGVISILLLCYSKVQKKPLMPEFFKNENILKNASLSEYDSIPQYELTIQNLVFEGINKDFKPYKIIAKKAMKTSDYKYKLQYIEALYKLAHNDLFIYADRGSIDDESKLLRLKDNVEIVHNDIMLSSEAMKINLINKLASSDSETTLRYNNSNITADSFASLDNNNIINFKGHVVAKIKVSDLGD